MLKRGWVLLFVMSFWVGLCLGFLYLKMYFFGIFVLSRIVFFLDKLILLVKLVFCFLKKFLFLGFIWIILVVVLVLNLRLNRCCKFLMKFVNLKFWNRYLKCNSMLSWIMVLLIIWKNFLLNLNKYWIFLLLFVLNFKKIVNCFFVKYRKVCLIKMWGLMFFWKLNVLKKCWIFCLFLVCLIIKLMLILFVFFFIGVWRVIWFKVREVFML